MINTGAPKETWRASTTTWPTMQEHNNGYATYVTRQKNRKTYKTWSDTYSGIREGSKNRERANKARHNTAHLSHTAAPNTNTFSTPNRNHRERTPSTRTDNCAYIPPSRITKQEQQAGPTNHMGNSKICTAARRKASLATHEKRAQESCHVTRYCAHTAKKYSSLTHLLIHLGIRESPYTGPTCTCPLKPDNISVREIWDIVQNITKPDKQSLITDVQNKARQAMQEKQKRHLEEDAPYNQTAPTKRLKLVLKPISRQKRARNTTHEPQQKRQKQ